MAERGVARDAEATDAEKGVVEARATAEQAVVVHGAVGLGTDCAHHRERSNNATLGHSTSHHPSHPTHILRLWGRTEQRVAVELVVETLELVVGRERVVVAGAQFHVSPFRRFRCCAPLGRRFCGQRWVLDFRDRMS